MNAKEAKKKVGHGGSSPAKAAKVYDVLREDILSMDIEPGSFLDEVKIADRFRVSRSPVREALIRLTADGFVSAARNRMTVVKPVDLSSFPQYMDALTLLQRAVTRLAALHRTDEDLRHIRALQDAFEEKRSDRDALAMINSNREFHLAIAVAGGNSYLTEAYGRLLDDGRRILRTYFGLVKDNPPVQVSNEHCGIIRAIETGDPEEAERLAGQHAHSFSEVFVNSMRRRDADSTSAVLPFENEPLLSHAHARPRDRFS